MDEQKTKRTTGESDSDVSWRQSMIVSGMALSLPAMLFGPPAIGYWLDTVFGTTPYLFLAFLVVGFIGTALDVYIILKRTGVVR